MKILDRYILSTYVKTFLSTFIILMFIFVLQTIWLYIKDLAGKDLDFMVILKFLMYFSPRLVTLVLPLTVLLTSIMTFGNFAENYEFAAMKSSGISLQRAMRSLMLFILGLSLTSFLFANYVIPAAEFESLNLRRNIAKVKPAMALSKGQYNPIGEDYTIKIAEKTGDNDQFLQDVIIYKKDPSRTGNFTVIKAREGELISEGEDNVLSLKLKDGNYYDEIEQRDYRKKRREPFVKSYFDTYTINIDLSELDNVDMEEKSIDNAYTMLNISKLDSSIAALSENYSTYLQQMGQTQVRQANLTPIDSGFVSRVKVDTTKAVNYDVIKNFELGDQLQILEFAKTTSNSMINSIKGRKNDNAIRVKSLSKYEIALHEKFVLAFGCIILFFVGAPLGAIIRKGGLGLPIVVGVVLFLAYHFIGIFAKNSAEDGTVPAWIASWLSTLIMLPLGIYLTYRATTDQGLFDLDGFLDPIKKLFGKVKKKRERKRVSSAIPEHQLTVAEKAILAAKNTQELTDIVRNYRQYNYSKEYRKAALAILASRGITKKELELQGNLENTKYENALETYQDYKTAANRSFIFYLTGLILAIPGAAATSVDRQVLAIAFMFCGAVSIIAVILFLFYLVRSLTLYSSFFKELDKKDDMDPIIGIAVLGIPLYFIAYFYLRGKMQEELKSIR